jgi:hypothetical protein
MPARWAFIAAFGISCTQLRHWCDAAHESGAWNTCGTRTSIIVLSDYVALQQQEPMETTGIIGLLKEMTP